MIEQKIHWSPRCVSLFCSMNFSIWSVVIELIWFLICSLFSSGKFSNWLNRCSLILFASSSVSVMLEIGLFEL